MRHPSNRWPGFHASVWQSMNGNKVSRATLCKPWKWTKAEVNAWKMRAFTRALYDKFYGGEAMVNSRPDRTAWEARHAD